MSKASIIRKFQISDEIEFIRPLNYGIINESFKVGCNSSDGKKYFFLQKINGSVFKKPDIIMKNLVEILPRLQKAGIDLYCLNTRTGENFYKDEENNYWRCFNFIDNSFSISTTDDLFLINQTGKAFGYFIKLMADIELGSINESIDDFHNTAKRYKLLKEGKGFLLDRCCACQKQVDYLLSVEDRASYLHKLLEKNILSPHITHNDTKCSNVLFNRDTNNFITVVDLDTVMPGLIAYDFGDGARSICASLNEESSKDVYFDLEKFNAYSSGFLGSCKNILSVAEKQTLYLGISSVTAELAVRFLIDYMQGDLYFKINYPNNNLVRAVNQIKLLRDIIKKEDKIIEITKRYLN